MFGRDTEPPNVPMTSANIPTAAAMMSPMLANVKAVHVLLNKVAAVALY